MFNNRYSPKGEQIMKEIYMEKEDAVSPVIATILMVAITVVLAATVYILVSHYTSVGAAPPLTASLTVDNEGKGTYYFYNLTITLSTPVNITNIANVHITVNGSKTVTFTKTLPSSSSGSTILQYLVYNTNGAPVSYIQSGSTIVIVSSTNLSGGTVSLTYTGYSGSVSTTLP